jgi:YVTN family beta-propeller protein
MNLAIFRSEIQMGLQYGPIFVLQLFKKLNMRSLLFYILVVFSTVSLAQQKNINLTDSTRMTRLPWNRMIKPAGTQITFGSPVQENHSLDAALSPDGKWLAVEERFSIVIISTITSKVVITLYNTNHPSLRGAMNTFSGITWHSTPAALEIYWSTVGATGRSYVASATWDGKAITFSRLFEYRTIPPAELSLPNELLISSEMGGEFLYVALNGCDRVIKQNLATGDTVWISDPGVAPYGLSMAAGKLYVTNWAGRHPDEGDPDVAGTPWGRARVDNEKSGGATREGSVAVIDRTSGQKIKDIITGLHPNDIISDKKGRYLYVTNSNSDNISVIDSRKDEVSETISVRLQPEFNSWFGDSPNALCLSADERSLYVANGLDNAIAVISLGKNACSKSKDGNSAVAGFIPAGAYPSSITLSPSGKLYVCNLEGEMIMAGAKDNSSPNLLYNSHRMIATISVIPVPGPNDLRAYTDTVIALNDLSRALSAREEPRKNVAPKPVPERIGEPSLFKHVLYIIKENRTYDQILGDMKQGDGDPALCIYGEQVTPNHHKLAEEFILFDRLHVSGKSSAEGHQWTDASIVTDYIEKNMRAWFRSYPHVQEDALVYSPTGFIWDNALKHGKSVRIYGEASIPVFSQETTWTDVYNAFLKGEKVDFVNHTTIEPVKKILSPTYPSYGNHEFPDVLRAADFIRELGEYEALDGDKLPELMVMALPNDHTAGTRPGNPTPRAMIADNDLALGQIIEALSKSRFWKNTVVFVIEDDSQSGWDHVSAFRTVGYVISPYSRLRSVNSTYYTQPSVVRTIEQILGLPPMNIQDAIANPMTDCFKSEPDLTPYVCKPGNIELNEMNPQLNALSGKALHFAKMSLLPEFDGIDTGNDDLMNRILWFNAKGHSAYPVKYAGKPSEEDDDEEEVIYE